MSQTKCFLAAVDGAYRHRSSGHVAGGVAKLVRLSICLSVLAALVCFFVESTAMAQDTRASITGTVTDPTGAVISDSEVTALNQDTGVRLNGRTDASGNYVVLNLLPGPYTISATKPGFATAAVNNAILVINQKLRQDFHLKPGAVTDTTTVTSAPAVLQTQSAETGTVIETEDILDLPLEGRVFTDLILLAPGTVPAGGSINTFSASVNGQREYANSIRVDGVESTTNRTQDLTSTPSVDAVQEFKVSTSAYDAELGRSGAGVISIQTKAGTNAFHGDAYEFFRPNFTAARPYSFGPKPPPSNLKQHNYGGTLGGPIKRNRAFFFASYEGIKTSDSYTILDSTPPIGQINFLPDGSVDLSHLLDPSTGNPIVTFDPNAFDPTTGTAHPFPNDIIPANRVSPAGKAILLNFFPKPNLPGTGNGWFNNFSATAPRPSNGKTGDGRYDETLTHADQLFVVYHYGYSDQDYREPYYGQTVVPGGGDADQANKQNQTTNELSASETHTFGPNKLNEFRFGYTRYNLSQSNQLNGHDYSSQFGVGNITVAGFPATVGFPYIFLGSGYLAGGSTYKPYFVQDVNYQVVDNFSVSQVGRHDLKFGGDFRRLNSHPDFSLFPTGFQYYGSFGASVTSDPTFNHFYPGAFFYTGGSDIADLLLGLPLSVDIGIQLTKPHTQSWEAAAYVQDTFKVNPKLTFNYGIRYEFQNPYTEVHNGISNFDPATKTILVAGLGGNSASLIQARKDQFGPRFGFAYLANESTVVRGGYGIYYSPENDGREDALTKNVPFSNQSVYKNPLGGPGPYAYQLDTGVPRNTNIILPPSGSGSIDPATIPNANLLTTYYVDPHLKTGTSQLFNFTVQQLLSQTLSLEMGYVGALAHNLSYQIGDINAAPDGSDSRVTPNLGKIQALGAYGWSKYNSLQVKLTKRSSRNLSFLASYTWGHAFDNGPAPFDLGHINNDEPQDPYNLHAETGSSDFDVRHNFVFSGLYRLPIGRGQHYFSTWNPTTNFLLGGWQLNSIFNMRSGTPVNVVRVNNPTSSFPGLRPDLVGNPVLPRGDRTLDRYFNTDAFNQDRFTGDMSNAPGTAGRNLFSGPGFINLDSSLFKTFTIREKYNLQTRLEAFNTFNTPHFANPDGNENGGSFGMIRFLNGGPRVLQLAAKFIF